MFATLRDILSGLWSLILGLRVTAKTGMEPMVTEQYPDAIFNRPFKRHGPRHREASERFRGLLMIRWDWENDETTCIACHACERVCPSKCIFDIESAGSGRARRATAFAIDLLQCCYCGLCVEACPVEGKAIMHTPDYETVVMNREELIVDLDWLHEHGKQYHPPGENSG